MHHSSIFLGHAISVQLTILMFDLTEFSVQATAQTVEIVGGVDSMVLATHLHALFHAHKITITNKWHPTSESYGKNH